MSWPWTDRILLSVIEWKEDVLEFIRRIGQQVSEHKPTAFSPRDFIAMEECKTSGKAPYLVSFKAVSLYRASSVFSASFWSWWAGKVYRTSFRLRISQGEQQLVRLGNRAIATKIRGEKSVEDNWTIQGGIHGPRGRMLLLWKMVKFLTRYYYAGWLFRPCPWAHVKLLDPSCPSSENWTFHHHRSGFNRFFSSPSSMLEAPYELTSSSIWEV